MRKTKSEQAQLLPKQNLLSAAFTLAKALKQQQLPSIKIYDEPEIRKWLEDTPAAKGWVISIGTCGNLDLDLYYDFTANGQDDTIWFGFYAEKQGLIAPRLAEYGDDFITPKSLEWAETNGFGHLRNRLTKPELRKPVYEGYVKERAYYFGIYDLTEKDGASFDVMRAIDFVEQSISSGKEFPKGMPAKIAKQINDRRGQPKFRQMLLKLYDHRCAVTGSRIVELLEAAHVQPFSDGQANKPSNGILMRADIHTLFDLGLIWIEQDYKIRIASSVRTEYGKLDGISLRLPKDHSSKPSLKALGVHAARTADRSMVAKRATKSRAYPFRTFRLGNFGEMLAEELLAEHGFSDTRAARLRQPGWDVEARDKDGQLVAVSVKCRNKMTNKGMINPIYYFFDSVGEREAKVALATERGRELRWLTIQVNVQKQTYTAHMGTLKELDSVRTQSVKFGVPMTEKGAEIGALLARDRYDVRILKGMSNV